MAPISQMRHQRLDITPVYRPDTEGARSRRHIPSRKGWSREVPAVARAPGAARRAAPRRRRVLRRSGLLCRRMCVLPEQEPVARHRGPRAHQRRHDSALACDEYRPGDPEQRARDRRGQDARQRQAGRQAHRVPQPRQHVPAKISEPSSPPGPGGSSTGRDAVRSARRRTAPARGSRRLRPASASRRRPGPGVSTNAAGYPPRRRRRS